MMTLDEAIIHTKEKIEEQTAYAKAVEGKWGCQVTGYSKHAKCVEEHKQLLEWLEELQERRTIDTNII